MALARPSAPQRGTQDFDSVEDTDVAIVIGANPAAGHPVFASRLKKRLRKGAKLIVIDPRRTEMVESPAYQGRPPSGADAPAPTWPWSPRSPM